MSDNEHSVYYSWSIAFIVLEESGQAYFSCARMSGFLLFFKKDLTYLLACLALLQRRDSYVIFASARQGPFCPFTFPIFFLEKRHFWPVPSGKKC